MRLTVKQKEFIRESCGHRWAIKHGATRSGKTYLDYFVIPMRIRERMGKDGLTVLLGNTKGTLQRNVIDPMQNIWGMDCVSDIKSDNTAILFGEKVYCLGADNVKHVDKLRGSSIKYCYGDEIVTWNSEVFDMLKTRLDKPYSHFDGTCNPKGQDHWLKQFIDSDADIYGQHYCIDDNEFLDEQVKANMKNEQKGVFYDRYILGLWVRAEGLVYPMFDYEQNTVEQEERKYSRYVLSIDYGIQNPFSIGLWGYSGSVWYRVDEYYHCGREENEQKTDQQYYDDMCEFVGDLPIECIIIDPSATSFITLIRQRHKYRVRKAKNSVLDGIQDTAAALSNGKIKINRNCKNIIREFGLYSWDDRSAEDAVIKEDDHCITGDTIVNTANGNIQIKDIIGKTGKVYCYDTENKRQCIKRFKDVRKTRENADIYCVELEDGRKIKCTGEHLILTINGYKRARLLTQRDEITDIWNDAVKVKSVKAIGKADVYNMEVEDVHNFSVNDGLIIHNCMDETRYFVYTMKINKTKQKYNSPFGG